MVKMLNKLTEMTWPEVAALPRGETIVLLPVAAHEQHGPHLPVGTDTIIADGVIESFGAKLREGREVLLLPTLTVGKSNEHMGFSGTLTLSLTTLASVVGDIARSVARHGFKKLVLLNSHGGNTDVLNALSRDLREELSMSVFVVDWWFTDFWSELLNEIQQSPRDGVFHAGELETSIVLALRPELVHMDKAVCTFPPEDLRNNRYVTIFGPVSMGWVTRDISKTGVIGDATKASAEKGRVMLEFAGSKLSEIVEEIAAADVPRSWLPFC